MLIKGILCLLSGLMLAATPVALGQDNKQAEGDKAWQELRPSLQPPPTPAEWRVTRPSREEVEAWQKKNSVLAHEAAKKLHDFVQKFPNHPKAAEAKNQEFMLLQTSVRLGNTNGLPRLLDVEKELGADPSKSLEERFELAANRVQRNAMLKRDQGMEAVMEEFEKGVRQLMKDFPNYPDNYKMLLQIASNTQGEKARKLLNEIMEAPKSSEEVREQASGILKRLDMVGKPLDLSFETVDGKKTGIKELAGKVVMIDFWATWCGPCMAELPKVKAAYEKYQPKGFEILGISFDQDKEELLDTVKKEKMIWPQYFDGKGWENVFGRRFGITGIPTVWLVDKKGVLRELDGRTDLEKKIEKLLAE